MIGSLQQSLDDRLGGFELAQHHARLGRALDGFGSTAHPLRDDVGHHSGRVTAGPTLVGDGE